MYVNRRSKTISELPPIVYGSMPNDGGNLILSPQEKEEVFLKYPGIEIYFSPFTHLNLLSH